MLLVPFLYLLVSDMIEQVDPDDPADLWFFILFVGLLSIPTLSVSIFQVYVRQSPILKIYREGIRIREVWTPIQETPFLRVSAYTGGVFLALFFIAFVMLWRFLTLQMFQTRTFYLRWENITDMWAERNERYVEAETLITIVGLIEQDHNDSEQDALVEHKSFSFPTGFFGRPLGIVFEAVDFFGYNPDARETLPSWQNKNILSGNETFDFDQHK